MQEEKATCSVAKGVLSVLVLAMACSTTGFGMCFCCRRRPKLMIAPGMLPLHSTCAHRDFRTHSALYDFSHVSIFLYSCRLTYVALIKRVLSLSSMYQRCLEHSYSTYIASITHILASSYPFLVLYLRCRVSYLHDLILTLSHAYLVSFLRCLTLTLSHTNDVSYQRCLILTSSNMFTSLSI